MQSWLMECGEFTCWAKENLDVEAIRYSQCPYLACNMGQIQNISIVAIENNGSVTD